MALAPYDDTITIPELTANPYPVYRKMRAESPVLRVASVGRTLLTRAEDARAVKDNPDLFSSNDPNTPMERAFHAQTLMRKDGPDHKAERMAMAPTFSPKNLKGLWGPAYEQLANDYLDRLPRDEVVDLFPALAGPLSARILAVILGIPGASDEDMQFWSQALIDGAGNFGWDPKLFERSDLAHDQIVSEINRQAPTARQEPDQSALSVMLNAENPIEMSQVVANIKIAIGGGINEPRDALLTILYGLLTNPDQLQALKESGDWGLAFEEGVRWVAPIQVSSRLVTEDTQIRGFDIPKGDVVMTVQASANRDEDLFENGDRFDVFRKRSSHQSFGSGPHHCLGTHLARMMLGKIMLPLIFDRFPNMELVTPEDVVWKGFGFRGPINLPVTLN